MVAARGGSQNEDVSIDSSIPRQSGALYAELAILVLAVFKTVWQNEHLAGILDISSTAYVFGFAIARGRPRAMLPSLFILWAFLRITIGPTSLNALIPGVTFFAFLLPSLVLVMPSNSSHLLSLLAIGIVSANAVVQSIFKRPKSTNILMGIIFTLPMSIRADAILAGWLLGLAKPFRLRCKAIIALTISATLTFAISASVMLVRSSVSPAVREAVLLPFLAAFVLAADSITAKVYPSLIRILLSALLVASPIHGAVSLNICDSDAFDSMWKSFLCVSSMRCASTKPRILGAIQACTKTSLVRYYVIVPVVLAVATAFYFVVHVPMERWVQSLMDRNPEWPMIPMDTSPVDEVSAHGNLSPKRSSSEFLRSIRVLAYFVAMGIYFSCFLYSSVPISFRLARTVKNPFFCTLPNYLYHCREHINDLEMGLMQRIAGSRWFRVLLFFCRLSSLLALPTLVINIIGHVVFPRANWNRIPSIRTIIHTAKVFGNAKVEKEQISQMNGKYTSHADLVPVSNVHNSKRTLSDNAKADLTLEFDDIETLLPFDLDFRLYFRYVTRGTSPNLVHGNCRRCLEVLRASGLPESMWRVEVVTDNPLNLSELGEKSIIEIVVPSSYSPPNGAMYKARALNYAIENSTARDLDWVVHLDEETHFDVDTVTAILEHCGRETYKVRIAKVSRWPRIGQGPIVYGRAMIPTMVRGSNLSGRNWVTTLADSARVADDCGRFRLQFELGEVWIGMHGSYVVAANMVERAVKFDYGMAGNIAEDAHFALKARSTGVRFAWIDALMFEQSPFSFQDFVKQRARWLVGGLLVAYRSRIPRRLRVVMATLCGLWAAMPLTFLALLLSVTLGSFEMDMWYAHWFYAVLLPTSAALSVWSYLFGFWVTFFGQGIGVMRFIALLYFQLLLMPLFGFMEMCGVLYGLINFRKLSVHFHVVEKYSNVSLSGENQRHGYREEDSEKIPLLRRNSN